MTANNSTNNNAFCFCLKFENSILKQLLILLDKRGKNILLHYVFGDKIIQNYLKIDAIH